MRPLRRFTVDDALRGLKGCGWLLAHDVPTGGVTASVQAIGNALRHARRRGLVTSRVVGPGNRSEWRLTACGQQH